MSMIVAHNIPGINTQRQFGVSARGMSGAMERLSSGFKINTGKDDPAGLLISEKLRSQLEGITRAKQNTEEAINVMGIAEGAMNEMSNILKKMKSLATHSANSGVTTSDQVEADQSEMDSAIQTMDRIAQTTQFSRENILNGGKELTFEANTSVKGTQQNSLINVRESAFDQIFKRDGYSVSITFTGGNGSIDPLAGVYGGTGLTADGAKVNFAKQATKAYLEVNTTVPAAGDSPVQPKAQISNGVFTQEQQFTLTGNLGSRQFTFGKESTVADMVKDIQNTSGSTGVSAALIFNSGQDITVCTTAVDNTVADGTGVRAEDSQSVFGSVRDATGAAVADGLNGSDIQNFQFGRNTDGQGNIYVKYVSDTRVEFYKDAAMSRESLVATGVVPTGGGTVDLMAANNSGLEGSVDIALSGNMALADIKNNYINLGGISTKENNGVAISGSTLVVGGSGADGNFDTEFSILTGVELGRNTDADGKLYFKTVNDGTNIQVFAYKDQKMEAKDLVAQSDLVPYASSLSVTLNQVTSSDGTAGTGLGIILSTGTAFNDTTKGTSSGFIAFENVGARIFATEYGSDQFLKITQDKGSIFTSFDNPGDPQRTMLESGANGTTKLIYGQDATVSVNGMEVKTNGLKLNVATQDIQARLTFNAGKPGSTTIAQVGYDIGSVFTRAGALNLGENTIAVDPTDPDYPDDGLTAYICNAGHSTNETIEDFQNGMQLQLGEGSGDQNRTVVSLRSMTAENLGRIVKGGYWDTSNPSVWSEKTFTLKDCLGGGSASLTDNPILTMAVIDQAIDDVASQRARIGAIQSNLLQTNANNLEVTLENVTKTESGIRDADMATEMAEFTKNQVLQSAAMSMMSQANQNSQNALQLLR